MSTFRIVVFALAAVVLAIIILRRVRRKKA